MRPLNRRFLKLFFVSTMIFSNVNAIEISQEKIDLINQLSAGCDCEDDVKASFALQKEKEHECELNACFIAPEEHPLIAEDEEEVVNNFGSDMASLYSTTHHAAYHHPINAFDGLITFQDKAVWQVHSWDKEVIKGWSQLDTVVIAPNTNIFTRWSYPFKLINLDTKEIVKAKLKQKPVLIDPNIDIHVHWIESIDYIYGFVRLEDGSLWKIHSSDISDLQDFNDYNIVIVGTNDGWFRASNPNILILVKNSKYIRGIVVN